MGGLWGRELGGGVAASSRSPQDRAQTLCRLPPAPLPRSVVAAACLGTNYCQVSATNTAFGGDPCGGVQKSLSFSYTCTNRVSVNEATNCPYTVSGQQHRCSTNGMIFVTALEGGMMKVRVFGNQDALNANLLGIGGTGPTRDVVSDNADNCSKFNQCPRGADIWGSISYVKTATATYTGAGAYASCPSGSTIATIPEAWYGCAAAGVSGLSVVQATCVGQAACTVDASNTLFGDPCPGTVKALTFTWTCA